MYGFLLGSSYGVSAGLIVYGIERDLITENETTFVIAWAVIGLGLAVLALILRPKSEK